jgi:hypothetical protein
MPSFHLIDCISINYKIFSRKVTDSSPAVTNLKRVYHLQTSFYEKSVTRNHPQNRPLLCAGIRICQLWILCILSHAEIQRGEINPP